MMPGLVVEAVSGPAYDRPLRRAPRALLPAACGAESVGRRLRLEASILSATGSPVRGWSGAMSIWPFFLGNFVELPYTMVQDYTLTSILGETTPRIWLDKVEFIRKYRGMVLLNTHPDYLKDKNVLNVYINFLQSMAKSSNYWHALPREVARWWRKRAVSLQNSDSVNWKHASAFLNDGELCIDI